MEVVKETPQTSSSNVSNIKDKGLESPSRISWYEIIGEKDENIEEIQQLPMRTTCNITKSIKEEQIQEAKVILDPDKVYWDDKEEMYVHASAICYDPEVNAYYIIINPKEGDTMPLYT